MGNKPEDCCSSCVFLVLVYKQNCLSLISVLPREFLDPLLLCIVVQPDRFRAGQGFNFSHTDSLASESSQQGSGG